MENKKASVGIIAAMECEIETLRRSLGDMKTESIAGTLYHTGRVGEHSVVCMQCGIGKVSAALGAQAMITRYAPDVIVNTGCAGALAPELRVGDLVLGDATVEWDLDITELGIPRGYVSALDRVEMKTDRAVTDSIAAVIGSETAVCRGLIVSGDQFISRNDQRRVILGAFPQALCAEMEGAAIGHVCAQNGVPFCVVRCISDNANGDSGVSFADFSAAAGRKSAEILLKFLNS